MVYGTPVQFALIVTSFVTVNAYPGDLTTPLQSHPLNSLPSGGVSVHTGSVYSVPYVTSTDSIDPVPPLELKRTVCFTNSQTAVTTVSLVMATTSLGSYSSPSTSHDLNCLCSGAVNPFSGSVQFPNLSVKTSGMLPSPSPGSNVKQDASSQMAYSVELPITK